MTLPRRIGDVSTREIGFRFAGRAYAAREGESVAAALLAAGVRHLRSGPVDGTPRGAFCFMGTCQECIVIEDGRRIEACRLKVRDGMELDAVG